jgi:GNAT superfamily N-acetyltransferase
MAFSNERGTLMSHDLLIRLYDLPVFEAEARVAASGVVVRRAITPEAHVIAAWVRGNFGEAWVSECTKALALAPVALWIAVKDQQLLGFACHDATMKGFFGPTGVAEAARGQGIGDTLLIATLRGMREAGYAYGVIGGAGPVDFYTKRLNAFVIPGSDPGIYKGMLRGPTE